VGLEIFQHIEQSILDVWIAGELSEAEMRRAFARNWSEDWKAHLDVVINVERYSSGRGWRAPGYQEASELRSLPPNRLFFNVVSQAHML